MPPGIVCKIRVVVRRDDDSAVFNAVRTFDVLRIEEVPPEPFAPDMSKLDAEGGDQS